MSYKIWREVTFSAIHHLRDYQGPCEKPHGHNWKVRVIIAADKLDRLGMVLDFHKLQDLLNEIAADLDHTDLNIIDPFTNACGATALNPTAEHIAQWFYEQVQRKLDGCGATAENHAKSLAQNIRVDSVMVWETEFSCAIYNGL